jgi:hypothetical protein
LWVHRDLWAERYGCRINGVFAVAGHDGLLTGLRDVGVRAHQSVCLQRGAMEAALDGLEVQVAVERPLRYWYPLAPTARIEDGRRLVSFHPPGETLSGERIHMWLGARYGVGRYVGDRERILRQQVFVTALLSGAEDLGARAARRPDLISRSGPKADQELARVDGGWRTDSVAGVVPATIDGHKVLLRRRLPGRLGRLELSRRARRLGGILD